MILAKLLVLLGCLCVTTICLCSETKPIFGIQVDDLSSILRNLNETTSRSGIAVRYVNPDGPGSEAGLRKGDIIHSINGHILDDLGDLFDVMGRAKFGDKFNLEVVRAGERVELNGMFRPWKSKLEIPSLDGETISVSLRLYRWCS